MMTSERWERVVLQYVQPGLAGLMDGSVSTLAPLFAAAFATHQNWQTFLVGLAASIGAGISMGFAEALSDERKGVSAMKSIVLTWFGMLAVVVTVFATMAQVAKTDPANVRAYGSVHGVVIPPFNG
jgi:hypothetical protein